MRRIALTAAFVLYAAPVRAEEGCAELERRARAHPDAGTLYDVAGCHQQDGRTATAWSELLEVAARARAAGRTDLEGVARDRASSIEPFLSKLVVVVRRPPPDLVIERDGVALSRNQIGTPFPIDPGSHTFVAHAPGRATWTLTVSVPDDGKVITVEVPELAHGAPPPMTPAAGPLTPRYVPTRETYEVTRDTGQRIVGVLVAVAGFGGVAVGTAFELDAIFKRDRSASHCDATGKCDADGTGLRDDARRETNLGVAAIVGGAAIMLGGVLLYTNAPTRAVRVAPMVGAGTSGFVIRGAF